MNAGLERINEILNEPGPRNVEDTTYVVPSAGEVLRMVANIVGRFTDKGSMPQLEAQIQDALITTIRVKFAAISELLRSETVGQSTGLNLPQVSQTTIFLARIVQFVLGSGGSSGRRVGKMWTEEEAAKTHHQEQSIACREARRM